MKRRTQDTVSYHTSTQTVGRPFRVIDLASAQVEVLIPVKLTQRTSSSAFGSTRCAVRGRSASARLHRTAGLGEIAEPFGMVRAHTALCSCATFAL